MAGDTPQRPVSMSSQCSARHNARMKQVEAIEPHVTAAALDQAGATLQRQLLRLRSNRRCRDCTDVRSELPDQDRLGQALLEAGLRIRRKA